MTATFDDVVDAPHRLKICAFLDAVDQAEFAVLRDLLGVAGPVAAPRSLIENGGA